MKRDFEPPPIRPKSACHKILVETTASADLANEALPDTAMSDAQSGLDFCAMGQDGDVKESKLNDNVLTSCQNRARLDAGQDSSKIGAAAELDVEGDLVIEDNFDGRDGESQPRQFDAHLAIATVGVSEQVSNSDAAVVPPYLRRLQALVDTDRHDMAHWAARYLADRVFGGPANTFEAKSRDLTAFIAWFVRFNGNGDIGHWMVRDTQLYLRHLEGLGRAPTTVNRALATLRHFARWVHEQPGGVFLAHGLPTMNVGELVTDEPDCQKFESREINALMKAAHRHVDHAAGNVKARPRRNRAILALLYLTGLRVSELTRLKREQYIGNHLVNIQRKGRARTKTIYLPAECRRYLDDYLEHERPYDGDCEGRGDRAGTAEESHSSALFLSYKTGRALSRQDVARALGRIADEANKYIRDAALRIHMNPHRLRHTFGAQYRERSGSDTETAATLGHTSLRYTARYVRKSQGEREALLEGLFDA